MNCTELVFDKLEIIKFPTGNSYYGNVCSWLIYTFYYLNITGYLETLHKLIKINAIRIDFAIYIAGIKSDNASIFNVPVLINK